MDDITTTRFDDAVMEIRKDDHRVLLTHKGVFTEKKDLEELRNMPVNEDSDLFIVTFPRSGTTLTQRIVLALQSQKYEEDMTALKDLMFHCPYLEFKLEIPGVSSGLQIAQQQRESNKSSRFMKTHMPEWLSPKGGKKIMVVRDVKDVLVSLYHFCRDLPSLEGCNKYKTMDFGKFYDLFIVGDGIYGDWFKWHRSWLNVSKNDEKIMWIRYEDLITNFNETVKKIAKFIGVEYTHETEDRLKELTKFQNMKSNLVHEPMPNFFRKGIIGNHVNYLSEEQIQFLDQKVQKELPDLKDITEHF